MALTVEYYGFYFYAKRHDIFKDHFIFFIILEIYMINENVKKGHLNNLCYMYLYIKLYFAVRYNTNLILTNVFFV